MEGINLKPKRTLFFGLTAGILALQFSFAEDRKDQVLEKELENLILENTLLIQKLKLHDEYSDENREEAISQTEAKMESDVRMAILQAYREEMDVNVKLEELVPGEFQANVGIATVLAPGRYAGLVHFVEKTITMDDVQVMIVMK